MRRFATKALSLAALVAALALAGCGGDDDSTTTATTTATNTTNKSADADRRTKTSKQRGSEKQRRETEQSRSSDGEPTATVPPFQEPTGPAPTASGSLPNEGTKRRAPGVPVRRYTDASVQTFGVEGPSADRVEAARTLQAFLNARLNGQWALACSYMSEPIKQQMEALAGQAQREGTSADSTCVQVMKAFGQGVPAGQLRTAAEINVLSMRVDGDAAIVIYRDGNGTPSTIPMNREGGNWKVSAAAGSVLFLGA